MTVTHSDSGTPPPTLTPGYESWLQRLSATHDALVYTCTYRLRDRAAAQQVGVQVVGGLLARPRVFRYSGLPYSGRIARLAEARIAAAREGRLPAACAWPQLRDALHGATPATQEVFVLVCVHGYDDDQVATELRCSPGEAAARRDEAMEWMRATAAGATPVLEGETTLEKD